MISYELAKQLKDAGFPQGVGNYLTKNSEVKVVFAKGIAYPSEGYLVYEPTLSELISACGESFIEVDGQFSLQKCDDCKLWMAMGWKGKSDIEGEIVQAEGSTPEEAVAKLWLALNTPKDNENKEK